MPIWRADYFGKTRDQVPTRSVIIEAEYESDALDEARAGMSSACCRAELTRIDLIRAPRFISVCNGHPDCGA